MFPILCGTVFAITEVTEQEFTFPHYFGCYGDIQTALNMLFLLPYSGDTINTSIIIMSAQSQIKLILILAKSRTQARNLGMRLYLHMCKLGYVLLPVMDDFGCYSEFG